MDIHCKIYSVVPVLWPQHQLNVLYADLVQTEHDKSHPQQLVTSGWKYFCSGKHMDIMQCYIISALHLVNMLIKQAMSTSRYHIKSKNRQKQY